MDLQEPSNNRQETRKAQDDAPKMPAPRQEYKNFSQEIQDKLKDLNAQDYNVREAASKKLFELTDSKDGKTLLKLLVTIAGAKDRTLLPEDLPEKLKTSPEVQSRCDKIVDKYLRDHIQSLYNHVQYFEKFGLNNLSQSTVADLGKLSIAMTEGDGAATVEILMRIEPIVPIAKHIDRTVQVLERLEITATGETVDKRLAKLGQSYLSRDEVVIAVEETAFDEFIEIYTRTTELGLTADPSASRYKLADKILQQVELLRDIEPEKREAAKKDLTNIVELAGSVKKRILSGFDLPVIQQTFDELFSALNADDQQKRQAAVLAVEEIDRLLSNYQYPISPFNNDAHAPIVADIMTEFAEGNVEKQQARIARYLIAEKSLSEAGIAPHWTGTRELLVKLYQAIREDNSSLAESITGKIKLCAAINILRDKASASKIAVEFEKIASAMEPLIAAENDIEIRTKFFQSKSPAIYLEEFRSALESDDLKKITELVDELSKIKMVLDKKPLGQ